jgi:hypothetical protein
MGSMGYALKTESSDYLSLVGSKMDRTVKINNEFLQEQKIQKSNQESNIHSSQVSNQDSDQDSRQRAFMNPGQNGIPGLKYLGTALTPGAIQLETLRIILIGKVIPSEM